jgi:hypothetical protein
MVAEITSDVGWVARRSPDAEPEDVLQDHAKEVSDLWVSLRIVQPAVSSCRGVMQWRCASAPLCWYFLRVAFWPRPAAFA